MKWNEILGLLLVVLFLSTLFTYNKKLDDPNMILRQTLSEAYHWEKYEVNGMRTAWDDFLVMDFRTSVYDLQYNNATLRYVPYYVRDSLIYMPNTFFFKDTSIIMVDAYLMGENDLLIYPHGDSLIVKDYIYMKRKIPYQY